MDLQAVRGGADVGLSDEIAAIRAGEGDPAALVGELRRTAVLVPLVADGGLMTASREGIRWIYAFTDEESLTRFAVGRGAAADAEVPYRKVLGARLLDVVIPALDGPAGVAVDVADPEGSMLFPPARGIVPDAVAVDAYPEAVSGSMNTSPDDSADAGGDAR